ncbi:MAG: T9SS type A sorting domain-containing protein [Bacteroidia bacterium]
MLKTYLTVFLFLILTNVYSQTSKYFPFPDSNAVWCDSICGTQSHIISGDIIIGSKTYHKLITNAHYYQIQNGLCDTTAGGYMNFYEGAFRQDTSARKVYFLSAGDTTETLLCDFTLNVGDTVRTYNTLAYCPNSVVTSIDSVLIGLQYRKQWNVFMPCYAIYHAKIIEGIGSTFGLLDQRTPAGSFKTFGKLFCFSQDNKTLYPNYSATSGCNPINDIIDHFRFENLLILPNPTSNQFSVETNTNEKLKLDLCDINGRNVLSVTTNNKSSIDVSSLSEGVYSITIKTANQITNKKLIIVR